jgi:clan AA aspartic protease
VNKRRNPSKDRASRKQGARLGLTYAELKLTNLFNKKSVKMRALVDTGAMHLCVPEAIAVQLGFDPTEAETVRITVADGRTLTVPRIAPINIEFANRSFISQAFVLGNEPLMGVVPIEAMDLIVDPMNQQLKVNPEHPNYAVFPVK